MKAEVQIMPDGPTGAYPVATLVVSGEALTISRRYGSWLIEPGGDRRWRREPEALGVDCMDLQALPEVKRFDALRRAEIDARNRALAEAQV